MLIRRLRGGGGGEGIGAMGLVDGVGCWRKLPASMDEFAGRPDHRAAAEALACATFQVRTAASLLPGVRGLAAAFGAALRA
jgi:hypothetical protein